MEHTIFYFTGTGNCLQVARALAAKFPEEVRLVRVCSTTLEETKAGYSGRIGVIYPSYSNNMPIMLKNFLEELVVEPGEDNYIYTVLVHGGMPGRVHVYLESIFRRKGTPVDGAFDVRLPHNGIVLFDAEPEEKQAIWFSGLDAAVQQIADAVGAETAVSGVETRPGKKALQKIGLKLPPGGPPMSDEQQAPNFLFDPVKREKGYFVSEGCVGCGICAAVCPADNITLEDGCPVWHGRCEGCMACIQLCPQQCVQCGKETQQRRRYRNPNVTIQDLMIPRSK